jgi:hypothetical protein
MWNWTDQLYNEIKTTKCRHCSTVSMVDQTIVSSKFGLIFFLAEKKIGEES